MADLYPTKTRLAVLREIAAGRATRTPVASYAAGRAVTAIAADFERVGWIARPPRADRVSDFHWTWQVTDAGRAVLDAHPEG